MKNRWKTRYKVLLFLAVVSCCISTVLAQKKQPQVPITELSKEENIATPAVANKQKEAVRNYMLTEARALVKMGYKVETDREGEVIVITIPAHDLFLPNETSLRDSGKKLLEPIGSYLKHEGRFKLILAMHSDDTGEENYKTLLTTERLDAVTAFIEKDAVYPEQMVGYAMADEEPMVPNTTRVNRDINRRLEIFIIPDKELITKLKK